jgi:hypothetical protein
MPAQTDQIPLLTTRELLERVRARHANCSDYRLAKVLDRTLPTIRRWVHGAGFFGRAECELIGKELGMPIAYVVACAEAEREKEPGVASVWLNLGRWSIEHQASDEQLQAMFPKPPAPPSAPVRSNTAAAKSRRRLKIVSGAKRVIVSALVLVGLAGPVSELRAESVCSSHGQKIDYAKYQKRRRVRTRRLDPRVRRRRWPREELYA